MVIPDEAEHEMARTGLRIASNPGRHRIGRACEARLPLAQDRRRSPVVLLEIRVNPRVSGRFVVVDREGEVDRSGDRAGPPAGFGREFEHLAPLLAPVRGIRPGREPAVEVPAGPLEVRAHRASHPDGRSAGTVRGGAEHSALHPPAALPLDRLARPERTAQAKPFQHAPGALLEGDARRLELVANALDIRGDPDAEDQPALRDPVERRHLMGEQDGIAECGQQHRGAEQDPPGSRRDTRKQGERFVPRPGEQAVAHPHRVVAERLGLLRKLQHRRHVGRPGHDSLAGGEQVAYLDWRWRFDTHRVLSRLNFKFIAGYINSFRQDSEQVAAGFTR